MPIYEYSCHACGLVHEAFQKSSDAPLAECPRCGDAGFEKLISSTSFQLKGSGWYVTDFKGDKKDAKDAKDPKGADKATSEAKPEKKADDKTAAKKESKSTSTTKDTT